MLIGAGLQEKLHKIEALFTGAGTPGKRDAAEAALERLRARLAEQQTSETAVEIQFFAWRSMVEAFVFGTLPSLRA